jgi:hypothetical protein
MKEVVNALATRLRQPGRGGEIAYETWLANFRRLFQEYNRAGNDRAPPPPHVGLTGPSPATRRSERS